jgi:hypothetical protein
MGCATQMLGYGISRARGTPAHREAVSSGVDAHTGEHLAAYVAT